MTVLFKNHKGTDWGTNSHFLRRLFKVLQPAVKFPQLAQAGATFSGNTILTELSLPLPDDVVYVCRFAGDDKGPAKSLFQWPRPMLYSGTADLSKRQADMLRVFLHPGLNKIYSLSTEYLTTCSRWHTHPVFKPRSFFMEGRKEGRKEGR